MLNILAHGAFGIWDEFLFFGIAAVFTIFMLYSWRKSSSFDPELDEELVEDE